MNWKIIFAVIFVVLIVMQGLNMAKMADIKRGLKEFNDIKAIIKSDVSSFVEAAEGHMKLLHQQVEQNSRFVADFEGDIRANKQAIEVLRQQREELIARLGQMEEILKRCESDIAEIRKVKK